MLIVMSSNYHHGDLKNALIEAGLRHKVEIWCDGGMKTGEDVVKMVLLGANRVGFGTMAMIAMGCTTCRQCDAGQCHMGIATQIRTEKEAEQEGLKKFSPLEFDKAVPQLERLFEGIACEVRKIAAGLGAENLQAAESRIRDADMAFETVQYTTNQILLQSSTAMLAQANLTPQSVLQLLG